MNYTKTILSIFLFSILSSGWAEQITAAKEDSGHESKLVEVPTPTAPHEVSSALCGQCHQEIYAEWEGSMHAKSSALKDPIHGALYRKVMGDPTVEGLKSKNGAYPVCLKCHAPNAAIQQKTKIDAQPAFNEGVNCITCHTITKFKGSEKPDGKLRLGVSAYEISKSSLQAPSGKHYSTAPEAMDGDNGKPFHPYPMEGTNAALFQSSDMCLGCHAKRNNMHGVPVCATGDEYKASKSSVSCQSCHMPVVNGRANHAMLGGHDPRMVARGVVLTLDATASEDTITANVVMKNTLPHKFPTGAPFRNVYLELTALNSDGKQLWRNFASHPIKDDKDAVLFYTLGDGSGNPVGAPNAKEVLADSRLEPHGEKTLSYEIPAKGATRIRAELKYSLILPGMKKMLAAVVDEDLLSAKRVALAEVELTEKQ